MTSSREQFGRTADAYAKSAVHARGEDLELLVRAIEPSDGVLLDIGTGAGHTLAALASKFRRAIGVDPTPEMLRAAKGVLRERKAGALLVQGDVEALPFREDSANAITCRVAAHHFQHPDASFSEIARVLSRGGTLYLVDNYAPADAGLDDFINTVERLRDPSHVREYAIAEWQSLLRAAGLRSELRERWRTRIELDDWLARSQTPPPQAAEVRRRFREAPPKARETFGIDEAGFVLLKALLVAAKP